MELGGLPVASIWARAASTICFIWIPSISSTWMQRKIQAQSTDVTWSITKSQGLGTTLPDKKKKVPAKPHANRCNCDLLGSRCKAKGWAAEWLAQPGSIVLSVGPEFESHQKRISECWERKKNPLAVLAARLGPLGHGPGFGGFLYPVSRLGFLLMKKWWGPFHTPG